MCARRGVTEGGSVFLCVVLFKKCLAYGGAEVLI